MANEDDEFGFKSLAEAFKPEVVRQEVATTRAAQAVPPVVSQPVPTRPVTPRAATPSLPEIKPEEVAASVPQVPVPELPPIENPVFNPELQKAAAVASLPAVLGGAALGAGAAYGLYKGRKSIQDRSIGKPMTAPADFGGDLGKQLQGMDMSRVSQSDLQLLQKAEANRIAKQAAAQAEINKLPGFTPPGTPAAQPTVASSGVPASVPPTIQGEIQTPAQNRIPGMMAAQEMSNPLGGLASAYTKPLRPPPTVAQMGQQSGGVISEAAKQPASSIPPEPQKEGKKRGASTKEERAAKQESYNKLAAESPEGFHPQYTKKKGEMGPGAYNWLYGQEGEKAPQVWKALFGDKNIPYSHEPSSELQSRYADYKLSVPEPGMGLNEPPRVEGGAHKKPKYIPKNIKGAISPGAALGSGAIAAALGLSASPEAQAAMQRASSAVQDLGVSPDIFAGKGEELGRLGSTYVTAGNPSYRAELLTEMKKTKDPERYQLLLKEYEKAKGNVPGGRGIAPPSAYMR